MKELEYVKELKLKYKEENGTIRRLNKIEKQLKKLEMIEKEIDSLIEKTTDFNVRMYLVAIKGVYKDE